MQLQLLTDAARTMVRATNPHTLKFLQGAKSLDLAREWKRDRRAAGRPGVLVLRYVTGDREPLSELPALTAAALREFDGFQGLAGDGIVVVLEVPVNERFHTAPDDFAQLAEASMVAAGSIKQAGFTPGVLVTSEGNPPGDRYGADFFLQPRVLGCLRAFRAMGAVWCPHGYSHPPAAADEEYHSIRPGRILALLPEDARLNYLYGEDGCDGGCDLPDKRPGQGWRSYFPSARAYADWYRAKSRAIAADPLCIGSAIFLCGADPGSRPPWDSFDVGDEVDLRDVFREEVPGSPILWFPPTPAAIPQTSPATPPVPATTPQVSQPTPQPSAGGSPVADVRLSVEERQSHAAEGNYEVSASPVSWIGVLIHSTGGPSGTVEGQYVGTINWFQNPDAGVSAHRVVGGGKFQEVAVSVHDDEIAYHGRSENRRRRGIEIAHGDGGAWDAVAYSAFQYAAAAELVARWHLADGKRWPIKLLSRAELAAQAPGIGFHRDTPDGIADGRRDPSVPFDGARLVREAVAWVAKLEAGTAPAVTPPPVPTPIPPQPGHWPNGRPVASSAEYDQHVWSPLFTAYQALKNGGNGGLGDDDDAAAILAIKRRSEERHGVKR